VSDEARDVRGRTGRRIELINGDTRQVVVVWPAKRPDAVDIVIGVDVSNAAIDEAVDAFESFGSS
jgi:predicted acylesterase/phospholipase RssA